MVIRNSIFCILFSCSIAYCQEIPKTGNSLIDSLLKAKKSNKKRKIVFDSVGIGMFNVNGVRIFEKKEEIIKKIGKGEIIKKKWTANELDIDNPTVYYKRFIKIKNTSGAKLSFVTHIAKRNLVPLSIICKNQPISHFKHRN